MHLVGVVAVTRGDAPVVVVVVVASLVSYSKSM